MAVHGAVRLHVRDGRESTVLEIVEEIGDVTYVVGVSIWQKFYVVAR